MFRNGKLTNQPLALFTNFLSFVADVKDGTYRDNKTAVMGLLLRPHDFSFHSSAATTRHRTISNRLIFITLFAVALALQVYGAGAVVDQSEQQDAELQSSTALCETKTLDDVPPDPVSLAIAISKVPTTINLLVVSALRCVRRHR